MGCRNVQLGRLTKSKSVMDGRDKQDNKAPLPRPDGTCAQSQYFCKGCKRHSTAGGTLRAPSRKKARAKSGGSAAGSNPAEVAVADVVPS
ncbi:hypothetical protein RI054_24g104410 [Pseudoscourfieldia marina]